MPQEKTPLEACINIRAPSSRKAAWRSWCATGGRTFTSIGGLEIDWAAEGALRVVDVAVENKWLACGKWRS